MKKIVFILISLFSFLFIKNVSAVEMEISAKSAILVDFNTGKVLYSKNENEPLAMASMTKVMSMLLIMEKIDDGSLKYDDIVEISTESSSMGGSQIFLNPGDKYKVIDLLKGVAMASANDAVVALAEKTYGSKEHFIEAMNKKAESLGLKNTHFVNVHGLDEEGHYSSAYDMSVMARELLKHEKILDFTRVYEEYLTKPDGSQIWLVNTNKLVRFYDGVDGLKTGFTQNAGYCLTATGKKNNLRLISVVMGEESIEKRSSDTVKLLNYGFNTFKVNLIKNKSEILGKVNVQKGKKENVDVVLVNDLIELLNVSDKPSNYKFKILVDKITAPVKKGDVIGKVKVLNDNGILISQVDITVNENVLKANLWDLFKRNLKYNLVWN
ncbi:MAG: D-alanyl-D-alanine carboxypeptidase family protein [Bacilli bacterium]|nr:D-alanyl-D-alanine carboxypeptidase family protein [Bacilli bacterium]